MIWDYTCSDTLAPSHLTSTSVQPGKSAEQAEKKKLAHYEHLSGNYIVKPIATETLGSWSQSSLKFVKEIGSRIADANGEPRSTRFLLQAIGTAIQRGNAASIRGTVPNAKRLDELYYL